MKSNPFPFAQLGSNCVQKTRGSLYLNLPDSLRRVPIDTGTSILLEQLNSNQDRWGFPSCSIHTTEAIVLGSTIKNMAPITLPLALYES